MFKGLLINNNQKFKISIIECNTFSTQVQNNNKKIIEAKKQKQTYVNIERNAHKYQICRLRKKNAFAFSSNSFIRMNC